MTPMTPPATNGLRDTWPNMRPSAAADARRRGMDNQSGFGKALSGAQDAGEAGLEATSLPPSAAQAAQSSRGTEAGDTVAPMPTGENAVAWTGPQAAAYSQQYGAPYPAAAEALTTPPPVAGPAVTAGSPDPTTGITDTFMANTPDAAAAYADAAADPTDPTLSSQQGFSEVA